MARRRQRAVTIRVVMHGLDDRSACCGLDERRCHISLHLRRAGARVLTRFHWAGSIGVGLGPGPGFVVARKSCCCGPPVDDDAWGFFTSANAELLD